MQLNKWMAAVGGMLLLGHVTAVAGGVKPPAKPTMSVQEAQQRLNARNSRLIQNAGQWDHRALYRARTSGLSLWLTRDGMVYDYSRRAKKGVVGQAIHLQFAGGNTAKPVGITKQPMITQFMAHRGGRPITAPSYASTIAHSVYPGIDVRTTIESKHPRFDFLVGPGADPTKIKLHYDGASSVAVRDNEIVLGTQLGDLKTGSLKAYQTVGGRQVTVAANFKMIGKNAVGISLGSYDHSRALVIDPLVYGSYYGGDDGFDEVRAITSDSAGGTYLTGSTQASQFPSTYGPFINLNGLTDSFLTKFQGDAYSHDFACYLGGVNDEYGAYLAVDAFDNIWVAGRTLSTDFPGNTRPNVEFLTGDIRATGGTFVLRYGNKPADRAVLPFDATTAQVQAGLAAMPTLAAGPVPPIVTVSPDSPGPQLPNAIYRIQLDNSEPLNITIDNNREVVGGVEFSEGLPAIIIVQPEGAPFANPQGLLRRGSIPTAASRFTLTFKGATTAPIAGTATAAGVQTALAALGTVGNGNVSVTGGPFTDDASPMSVQFMAALLGPQPLLISNNAAMLPVPVYTITKFSDVFIMRFSPDATTILAPQETMMFGGDRDESLSGFAIVANPNPQPVDPVEFVFAGDIDADANGDLTGAWPGGSPGYLARYDYDPVGFGFTQQTNSSFYQTPGPGAAIDVTGLALDSVGAAYIGGTVRFIGNNDTSVGANPPFLTTAGVFNNLQDNGRQLKNNDMFLRKYAKNTTNATTPTYSCLIGGNNNEAAGGLNMDLEGNRVETGSCVAVDASGNAYITGISTSFNYPRTRGVFGEVFDNNANVVVTKLNPDASLIIYSTNLRTAGDVRPAGIAVDSRGFAFITGNAHPTVTFPATDPPTPADPASNAAATVRITNDAIDPTWDMPTAPSLGTVEPWLNVLNETATTLRYGTFLGGFIDDVVYAPYVDRFNDVWVNGWTDSLRFYFNVGGQLDVKTGALPDAMISPLAFKSTGDAVGQTGLGGVWYGNLAGPPFGPFTPVPYTLGMVFQRDGFLAKLRVGAAAISGLSFNPTTIAGGLGATSTGTVTLSDPAPPGGADVEVTITDTSAGSFSQDQNNPVSTIVVTIPEATTSTTFTFYTYPVSTNTQVQAKASFQGSFKIAQITVVPWLQTITLTPTSVVGGNSVSGRVTLSQAAPTGGVDVDLLTDSPTLIVLPNPPSVNVPAGQTSVTFTVGTHGVVQPTNCLVSASLLGAGRSQLLTLTQCKLVSVSFNPTHVAGGSSSTGTVQFDGESGAPFDVFLSLNAGTAGYSINGGGTSNVLLQIPQGVRNATFTVQTAYEAANTNRKLTAVRNAANGYLASSSIGTLFIDAVVLSSLSISPNPVTGGQPATGTVQLGSAAPTGGAIVFLSSTAPSVASVPVSVTVPAGSTTTTFPVTTFAQPSNVNVTIQANRGPGSVTKSVVLQVQTQKFTLTVSPKTVVGGLQNSQGTITLTAPPPAGGLLINLTSSNTSAATVPLTVNCTGLVTHFTITSLTVTSAKTTTIKGQVSGSTFFSQDVLTVKPLGVVSLVLSPSTLRGTGTFNATVTVDTAVAANMTLHLNYGTNKNKLIANPSDDAITILAGHTSGTKLNILTKKVSRTLATSITVTLNGKTVSATLTVTP